MNDPPNLAGALLTPPDIDCRANSSTTRAA